MMTLSSTDGLLCLKKKPKTREIFGAKIGASPNGVISYSSCFKMVPRGERYNSSFILIGKTRFFTGTKWQCVEYARRYLLLTFGVTFSSIPMAWNIFTDIDAFQNVADKSPRKINKHLNGSVIPPIVHSLLIWTKACNRTGHVAVITNVTDSFVEICEQNWDQKVWKNPNFSRRLPLVKEGELYFIKKTNIFGWINLE